MTQIIVTIKESHLDHPWFGANLVDLIGTTFISGLDIRVAAEIQETLERYVNVQMKQSRFQAQTPNEKVRELVSIDVDRGTEENSDTLFINIVVRTDALTLSEVTFGLAQTGAV